VEFLMAELQANNAAAKRAAKKRNFENRSMNENKMCAAFYF
jgi:hypothetical protein